MRKILAAILLCAAPVFVAAQPIKYTATFTASGTLDKPDGTTEPFSGTVVFSLIGDTKDARATFDDGVFAGYLTFAPLSVFIEGIGEMKSTKAMELFSQQDEVQINGYYQSGKLSTFLIESSGLYNLKSDYATKGVWYVNAYSGGVIPTTKGNLSFTLAQSNGGFAGSLVDQQ